MPNNVSYSLQYNYFKTFPEPGMSPIPDLSTPVKRRRGRPAKRGRNVENIEQGSDDTASLTSEASTSN
jgi:hypothetical protein